MKRPIRLLSLLLALTLCCAAFFACNIFGGKETKTEEGEDVTPTPESKEPKGSYKLLYRSNGDGTCYVSGIEVSEDAENLTLVIPETSPDGEKVTGYHTDALSFANIPLLILEEDFVNHIDAPTQQAVKDGKLIEFYYKKLTLGFFIERTLEVESEKAKEFLLQNYPMVTVSDLFEFVDDASLTESAWVSYQLFRYANYTSAQYFADTQKYLELAKQNNKNGGVILPVNADAVVSISLPSSLESMDSYALFACRSAEGNAIDNVVYFGNEKDPYLMLYRATDMNVTSVVMPETVKFISEYAFYECKNLESVSISNGVTTLGDSVFRGCISLKSIIIPEGVTTIGHYAFAECKSLIDVVIPKSVVDMDSGAFANSENLKNFYYTGTAEEWNALLLSMSEKPEELFPSITVRYYSESAPTDAGSYWHYVDGVPTVWN